jgi:hypothetical protein
VVEKSTGVVSFGFKVKKLKQNLAETGNKKLFPPSKLSSKRSASDQMSRGGKLTETRRRCNS